VRIGSHFRRAEVRKRVGRYLQGLLASVERKNGWQMAEELGEANAYGVQRLLEEADWDEEAVRDELRSYVIEQLGEPAGTLVMDETGFVKKGKKSAGVARQYSGTAGRRENSQIGVFLLYASSKGAAFIDRALYLPEEWTADRVRCREAGIPDEVEFARHRRAGAADAGPGVCGGSPGCVGGGGYGLRLRRVAAVVGDPAEELCAGRIRNAPGLGTRMATASGTGGCPLARGGLGRALSRRGKQKATALQLPDETEAASERARWLLIRRSLSDRSERAYYRVYGPATTTLAEIVRVTGSRWKIEEGYEQAKGQVGLDQYEVRTWRAWYRYYSEYSLASLSLSPNNVCYSRIVRSAPIPNNGHVTLALLAYAALVVMQGQARAQEKKCSRPGVD
jgi:DDE superfamily endonuclease